MYSKKKRAARGAFALSDGKTSIVLEICGRVRYTARVTL